MFENKEVNTNIDFHSCPDQLRENLCNMSETTIMKMLNEWTIAAQSSGQELDPELIVVFYEVLDEIAPLEPIHYDFHASWNRFMQNNPGLFETEEDAQKKSKQSFNPSRRIFVAMIAAVILLLGTAYATDLPEFVYLWGQDFFQMRPDSGRISLATPNENGFTTLGQALDAYNIALRTPTWIPERYQLEEISVSLVDRNPIITALYDSYDSSERPLYIRILKYPNGQNIPDMGFENDESSKAKHLKLNGYDAIITKNEGITRINWVENNCAISISGSLSEFELKQLMYFMN